MRTEDKLLCLGIFIGFGFTVAAMALPLWYPNAPQWMWGIMLFGGLAVAAYSFLVLAYELLMKPHLVKEVKMIPLLMIICGFLLMIGGIIYHLHDKNPKFINLSPAKQPTAEEKAIEDAKKLPLNKSDTTGNLKERAIKLSDEIMEELHIYGYKNPHAKYPRQFSSPVLQQRPTPDSPENAEKLRFWEKHHSDYFINHYLDRVYAIKEEFSQLHIRSQELDKLFERYDSIRGAQKQMAAVNIHNQLNYGINTHEIEKISDCLMELAE